MTRAPGVNYDQYWSFLLARGLADHSATSYVRDLHFIERKCETDATSITVDHLDRLFARRGLSAARNQRLRNSWNNFVVFAQTRLAVELPKADYSAKVRWKPKPSLTPDQRQHILQVSLSGDRQNPSSKTVSQTEDGLAVALLLLTGMRSEEARTRKVSDVNFEARTLTILGKEDKTRVIPLAISLESGLTSPFELISHLTSNKTKDNFILSHRRDPDRAWSASRLYMACARVGASSNLPDLHPHQLRRGWATDLRRRGIDIAVISKLLGHSSLDVTRRYLGVDDYDVEVVRDLLEGRKS